MAMALTINPSPVSVATACEQSARGEYDLGAWMERVIGWIERHAPVVQALTAIVTMLIAIGALVGVKVCRLSALHRRTGDGRG